ncbi:MAG: hypothetical protein DID92_2727745413 [Candidatus Nitrotoga sp. SPKER]|nr:MAG: hypothetical protein DID92_2727745413 [Candidatus Nitrotoga sp. SPKER]
MSYYGALTIHKFQAKICLKGQGIKLAQINLLGKTNRAIFL